MPKRGDSMYDGGEYTSGNQLKAEIKRASVIARKSMARVNQRKMGKRQDSASMSMRGSASGEMSASLGVGEGAMFQARSNQSTRSQQSMVGMGSGVHSMDAGMIRVASLSEVDADGDEIPIGRYDSLNSMASWQFDDITHAENHDKEWDSHWKDGHKGHIARSDAEQIIDDTRRRERQTSLSWIDMRQVEVAVIIIIVVNMYCLAMETDYPKWSWWKEVNGCFLFLYIAEFSIRVAQKGPVFLLIHARGKYWMWYDLVVIFLGVADLIASFISGGSCLGADQYVSDPSGHSMLCADDAAVRFLMLTRLLRALRMVRMIQPLYVFVKQLGNMIIGNFLFILSVIFLICFVFAIIFTRILGHGLLVSETAHDQVTVKYMFKDVPSSLFALFQLTTADDWARIALPVISAKNHPVAQFMWRIFFMIFITFMSWTMLSLLTAVASEAMITNASTRKSDEVLRQELERQGFITFLCDEFERADADANGVLDKQEFLNLMTQEHFRQEMKAHGLSLEERDVGKTWDTFDVDESGELTIEELVYGFSYLQEGLATKHVASIGYSMKRMQIQSERDFMMVEEEFEEVHERLVGLQSRLDDQHYINQQQWNHFLSHQTTQAQQETADLPDDQPRRLGSATKVGRSQRSQRDSPRAIL